MSEHDERDKLRSYLAAQSAKLSAAEIGRRLREAADEFLAAVKGCDEAAGHRVPAPGEWSVAEIVDHVTITLEDAAEIIRALGHGGRSRGMSAHPPVHAAQPLGVLVDRLGERQAVVIDLLADLAARGEPHTDVMVADDEFGEMNWKGYALILRLHYKDHAQQVLKTRQDAASTRASSAGETGFTR